VNAQLWILYYNITYRFMGSLTALLVLATLSSLVNADLPTTSYFKVIIPNILNIGFECYFTVKD
jgi:hypothetical protein